MSDIFEDIEGVEVVVDDLLIWGENEAQHDERLRKVLERTRQSNLKLNKGKSQIKLNEIYTLPISEPKLETFKEETAKDPSLQELKCTVENGWLESKSYINPIITPYWNC